MERTYSECISLPTWEERLAYLQTFSQVGDPTLAQYRYLCEEFYRSYEWRKFRRSIIIRDDGCDLATPGIYIPDHEVCVIHHIEPLALDDFLTHSPALLDPENVILVSSITHNQIHYGQTAIEKATVVERTPFDTCPWRL